MFSQIHKIPNLSVSTDESIKKPKEIRKLKNNLNQALVINN